MYCGLVICLTFLIETFIIGHYSLFHLACAAIVTKIIQELVIVTALVKEEIKERKQEA